MNTKLIMVSSALGMLVLGVGLSFFPGEILDYLCKDRADLLLVLLQLLGALYLGFAMLNWMAKGILLGGIYARPLAMGNFLHFFVGFMALLKSMSFTNEQWTLGGLLLFYLLYAVLFGIISFRHPLKNKDA